MLNQVYEELSTKVFNDFQVGDSGTVENDPEKKQFGKFLGDLKDVSKGVRRCGRTSSSAYGESLWAS